MKAKKALKRLTRVEALLSDVLDQYSAGEQEVRESLDSAKAAVARAWESVNRKVSAALETKPAAKKPAAKAKAKPAKNKKAKRLALVAKAKAKPAVAGAKKRVAKAPAAAQRRVAAKRAAAVPAPPPPAPVAVPLSAQRSATVAAAKI